MKTVPEVLMEAAKLVRRGWCKGWFARTRNGSKCDHDDPLAVSWCVMGALKKATNYPQNHDLIFDAQAKLQIAISPHPILLFNDQEAKTAEEVAQKLEEAASLATKGDLDVHR
jgi:hypothetical protein